jgi:beta-lactamase superfamily II metal-dependent hydrolase
MSNPGVSSTPSAENLLLRVIQADYGDSLILEYGAANARRHILVDGGPEGVYEQHLKPELQTIAQQGGKMDLMLLSHVDEDHVVGLVALMSDLAQGNRWIGVDRLWLNTFRELLGGGTSEAQPFQAFVADFAPPGGNLEPFAFSISQGEDLWIASEVLKVPLNPNFPSGLVTLETAPRPVTLEGLKLWILGPSQPNLERFRKEWLAWYKKNKGKTYSQGAARAARSVDKSFTNLSSILFLAEGTGRKILMTGDGRGEDILYGLEKTGRIPAGGNLHVDVLKVPHHGSNRNSNEAFFQRITADVYVISAAKHNRDGNPDLETLKWIVGSPRRGAPIIEILATNATEATRQLVKDLPPAANQYKLTVMKSEVSAAVV